VLLAILGVMALALTCTMFASKQAMLGFPCLIFWTITGGQSYLQSTATWDIYYILFFGSFGMAIFCTFAAYALRTKKEELAAGEQFIDEGKPEEKYIDESGPSEAEELEDKPSKATRELRERAEKRRSRWK